MVIGYEDGVLPSPGALETGRKNETWNVALGRDRNLAFVACMRRRDRFFVSTVGRRRDPLTKARCARSDAVAE